MKRVRALRARQTEIRMKVGLFIPCYINALYPDVGRASYELLRHVGCEVDYPLDQTCCGQPMANAGFEKDARELAERMERLFAGYDYVVGPSASCAVFVREGYPRLLPDYREHACLDARIWEICEFLHDVVKPTHLDARFPHRVSLHNSCHGKGSGTPAALKKLAESIDGLKTLDFDGSENCCGFGGTFSVKEPEISNAMVTQKVQDIASRGVEYILSADAGCLLNISGAMKKQGVGVKPMHWYDFLAQRIGL